VLAEQVCLIKVKCLFQCVTSFCNHCFEKSSKLFNSILICGCSFACHIRIVECLPTLEVKPHQTCSERYLLLFIFHHILIKTPRLLSDLTTQRHFLLVLMFSPCGWCPVFSVSLASDFFASRNIDIHSWLCSVKNFISAIMNYSHSRITVTLPFEYHCYAHLSSINL
jgi:hypothetical protein